METEPLTAIAPVSSFDVFDTVLRRRVQDPTQVFERVTDAIGDPGFTAARVAAQRDAHRFGREATLEGIYRLIARRLTWTPEQAERVMAVELETERSLLVPVPSTAALMESLRAEGHEICFVTDMYLPGGFIAGVLEGHGLKLPHETLLVSCELGRSKRRGSLFPRLRRDLPQLVRHHGDDAFADVHQARRAGIDARLLPGARPTAFERALPGPIAETLRQVRSERPADAGKLWDLGAGLTAPMAVGLLRWIDREAGRRGVDRLLFLARDAQLLERLYTGGLPRTYLCCSRHSLNNCLFDPRDPGNREWLFALERPTVRAVLANCNLTPESLADPLAEAGVPAALFDRPLPLTRLMRTMDDAFAHPGVAARLGTHQEGQLASFAEYLHLLGVGSDESLAVVDLGWRGTIQRQLGRILPRLGFGRPLTGFYFGCNALDLDAAAFLSLDPGWLARYRVLVEVLFPASHGQTLSYRDGAPVLAPHPHLALAEWEDLRRGAEAGAAALAETEITPAMLARALEGAATEPDWHLADLLAGVRFNAGLEPGQRFLEPRLADALRAGMPWPEGYLRWRFPAARGARDRALRAAAWGLREARYARRWMLSRVLGLRKP